MSSLDRLGEPLLPKVPDQPRPAAPNNVKGVWEECKAYIVLSALATLVVTGLGCYGHFVSSSGWFHQNATGLMVAGIAMGFIGLNLLFWKKYSLTNESTRSNMLYAYLAAAIAVCAITFVATSCNFKAFDASNRFMLDGANQWQGWLFVPILATVGGVTALIVYKKRSEKDKTATVDWPSPK